MKLMGIYLCSLVNNAVLGFVYYRKQNKFCVSNFQMNTSNDDIEGVPENVSVIKIDDHGSDLTDRFKYKVNALMGTFDPPESETDDENQNGNIIKAMLFFPTQYTFNVVGKTSGDDEKTSKFIENVKKIVSAGSGDPIDEMECVTKPRGKNYTKISITAMVDSADIINNIYEELSTVSVMRFWFIDK